MKGWVADHKSVLIFQQRDQVDGVPAQFEAQGDFNEIHANLRADGLTNHTLLPTATGATTVYVAHLDNTQTKAIETMRLGLKRHCQRQVIEELIRLAKDIRAARARGEETGVW